ncbi:MAG TPA: glycosyltransferase family 4 protein [Vicinamibacterales bacterium]|nr:glycosyltransferase family 4 protein [Vicinamibacterales bacterium]
MRVCFFNRSYWPDQAATGQLLTELAQDLVSRHGWTVSVVAGRALHASHEVRKSARLVDVEEHGGVRILRANGTAFDRRRFAGRAANYLTYFASALATTARIGSQDVVVSLTDPPILGLAALLAARRAGARFVFLCEDVFPEVAALLEDFQSTAVNRTLDRINRYLLREADAVVALGERMKRRLVEEKGAAPSRVYVIHNWADCDAIMPGPKDNAFSRAHGLADRFVLMHSGNVGLSQNLDLLVEAAARLQSCERLVIAVVGDGARRQTLQDQAFGRGLSNIRFFPYQPKELLHESFASADAFLVSLKPGLEGYIVPSKLYGILASGRPFVAAVDPSCEAAMIAREHQCGTVAPPGDVDALVAAIAALHDNPAATHAMGANARRASLRYDRRLAVQAYHDLFAGLNQTRSAA